MFIIDDALNYLFNTGINKAVELYKNNELRRYLEEIKEQIENDLKSYETEPYYTSLEISLVKENFIQKIIERMFSVNEIESVESILDSFAHNYFLENPEYIVLEKDIFAILKSIYKAISDKLYKCGLIDNTEKILMYTSNYARKELDAIAVVAEKVTDLQTDLSEIKEVFKFEKTVSQYCNYSILNDIDLISYDNTEISKKIKDIKKNLQEEYDFEGAISKYKTLLTELFESNCKEEPLYAEIYINIALCYANIFEYDEAKRNIALSTKHSKEDNNSKLHYVTGYIIWKENKNDEESLIAVKTELIKALDINPKYISAKLLLCIIESLLKTNFDNIVKILKDVEKDCPSDRNFELCQTYGIVYRLYGLYDKAESYFLRADEEIKEISNCVNLGILYYSWATCNCEYDKRYLKLDLDYSKMYKALFYLEKVMLDSSKKGNTYREEVIEIYISACMLCNHYDKLDIVQDIDINSLDYEVARIIIFHRIRKGDKSALLLLSKEDKEFHQIIDHIDENPNEALNYIITNINQIPEREVFRYYNLGLKTSLIIKDNEKYRYLRNEVKSKNIDCPYLDLYDAEYNILIGDEQSAKKYFDSIIHESNDECVLIPAIKFYKERNLFDELSILYENTLINIVNKEISYSTTKSLVVETFSFFIDNNTKKALELFKILNTNIVGEESYNLIKHNLFYKIRNIEKLLEANRVLQKYNPSLQLKINEIVLLKYSMCYIEAHDKALLLLQENNLSEKDVIIIYELLSECALFLNDNEKSIDYISKAKDLAKELVYDPVHQIYMGRLLRCGNHDGIKYGIDFQETHPNVANWIKPIVITKDTEDRESVLSDEFESFLREQNNNFKSRLSFYNKHMISLYQFKNIINNDMLNIFIYPKLYGIKVCIGFGSNKNNKLNANDIGNEIVIDAFTLIFLEYFKILNILDTFDTVHITYSTIEDIQNLYLKYDSVIISNILKKLYEDLKFEKSPDYSQYNDEETFLHPKSFLDALELAKEKNIKFLCFDAISPLYFSEYQEYFIGINTVIDNIRNNLGNELSQSIVYKLMNNNLYFIKFTAKDMIYALEQDSIEGSNKIKSYLKFKSNYDIDSFCSVYIQTIKILFETKNSNFDYFLELLLDMIDNVYNWINTEMYYYINYLDEATLIKSESYLIFIIKLLSNLFIMFKNEKDIYDKICKRTDKHLPKKLKDKIIEVLDKNVK